MLPRKTIFNTPRHKGRAYFYHPLQIYSIPCSSSLLKTISLSLILTVVVWLFGSTLKEWCAGDLVLDSLSSRCSRASAWCWIELRPRDTANWASWCKYYTMWHFCCNIGNPFTWWGGINVDYWCMKQQGMRTSMDEHMLVRVHALYMNVMHDKWSCLMDE